jgi:hypothetical protein
MEVKGKNGQVKGLFIPLANNHIFEGEKGCYLDIIAYDLKEPKNDQTHLVKQSLPKTVREAMSDEQKKAMPIIGNLNTAEYTPSEANNDVNGGVVASPDDDLPF